jgi:hypothetical protein
MFHEGLGAGTAPARPAEDVFAAQSVDTPGTSVASGTVTAAAAGASTTATAM